MLYPLQLLYLTMANLDSNINPISNPFPEAAGKFFAGINAGIRAAEKNALTAAEKRLPPNVQDSIKKHRDLIEENRKTIQNNPTKSNILKRQNAITQQRIDKILSKNGFRDIYDNLQNEKRIEREKSRKRRREPDSVPVPSDADLLEASKEADAAIAAADELLEEPENELPPPPPTEAVTAPSAAQAEEMLPPPPPPPPTEKATTDANKLAKVLVDSLMSAAQSSIKIPPSPTLPTEEVEADAPAPFNVTSKPQPEPVVDPTNAPAAAVAETIVNALEESNNAVELPPQLAPAPVQEIEPIKEPTTISPGALANVIVNALKLASTTPPIIAPVPAPVPLPAPAPAPAPVQAPAILPGALANVIVNALKLASTQAIATQEPVTPTIQEPVTPTVQEPVTPPIAGDKCGESPGFIALIKKYLEPIIEQFSPPETKPQKEFDKAQLPENMRHILDDTNIKYIGRYRTETKPGKNELSKEAHQQTTYLFWNTSTHDYTSQTVTDVVNNVIVEEEPVQAQVQGTQAPVQAQEPAQGTQAQATVQARASAPRTRASLTELDKIPLMPPMPPNTKTSEQTLTTNELLEKLPPVPTTIPQGTKKRRIETYVPAMI